VAAIADPHTGVAVYDSLPDSGGRSGWLVFGGTSVAAPLVAGVYALAGNAATAGPDYPYAHPGSLHDITSGSNGTCSSAYLCTAGPGYDGPTGLGTPAGTGAF
jgi:subtilisin family serine protease